MYEILIRGTDDGTAYKGAHCIAKAGDMPRGIADAQWPAVCASINAMGLARVDVLESELEAKQLELDGVKAELDQLKATAARAAQAVVAVVDDKRVDDKRTVIACREIAINVLTPVRDREIAAARQRIADEQARLAALMSGSLASGGN